MSVQPTSSDFASAGSRVVVVVGLLPVLGLIGSGAAAD
jgi:hypothetical protein